MNTGTLNKFSNEAIKGREDYSQFIVHLTRNDDEDYSDGNIARNNFQSILKDKAIKAFRPHCLFNNDLTNFSDSEKNKFNVVCFTEIPLNQLHLLTKEISGRKIKFEPYGFVFKKELLIQNGAQPAIYINSYGSNFLLRDSIYDIWNKWKIDKDFNSLTWRLFPFVNAMYEKYDFSWEREWRLNNDFEFKLNEIVSLIMPSDEIEFRELSESHGISVITPGWTYEQIVSELAKQQRNTKKIMKNKISKPKKSIVSKKK
jgi:hypothetical protein